MNGLIVGNAGATVNPTLSMTCSVHCWNLNALCPIWNMVDSQWINEWINKHTPWIPMTTSWREPFKIGHLFGQNLNSISFLDYESWVLHQYQWGPFAVNIVFLLPDLWPTMYYLQGSLIPWPFYPRRLPCPLPATAWQWVKACPRHFGDFKNHFRNQQVCPY